MNPAAPRQRLSVVAVCAIFVGLSVASSVRSTAFIEADDVTHYLYSRWLFEYPRKAVDIWGRPLVTLFYALPAQLGPLSARLGSILLGLVAVWTAWRVAASSGLRRAALVVAATLGLPYVFTQTCGILTELLFAALLGLGFVAYRSSRPRAAALAWSLLPLARPEGFFLGLLFGLVFLFARRAHTTPRLSPARFANAMLLGSGTAVWWLSGLPIYRSAAWLIEEWPKNWAVESVYGHGHPLHFVGFLAVVVTPALIPPFVVGARVAWLAGRRLELLVIGFVVGLHATLWTLGLFGSAGYPRYLVTVAPLIGAVIALGIERLFAGWTRLRSAASTETRWRRFEIGSAALLATVLMFWPNTGPVLGDVDVKFLTGVWPWCSAYRAEHPTMRFVVDHPAFTMIGDFDPFRRGYQFKPKFLDYAEVGDVAVWESKFAARYSGIRKEDLARYGFEPLPRELAVGPGPHAWEAPRPPGGDPELADFQWDVLIKRR